MIRDRTNDHAGRASTDRRGRPVFIVVGGFVAFVLLMLILAYANHRIESIERKLSYRPPDLVIDSSTVGDAAAGHRVYVPVYSHIYSQGGRAHLLETTLSIRNTDLEHPIKLIAVRYYDTEGRLVRDYVPGPVSLPPLATREFLVEQADVSGGSGANFIAQSDSDTEVNEPVIEAVMVGVEAGRHGISFPRPGIVPAKIEPETD
jgi:hypothetical protein